MSADTQIVFDFKGYKIESMTDEYGRANCLGNVYPCFWVRDTAGYMGVLSPLGKVLMRDISFKYKAISGIGDGLFLGPNQLNPKSYSPQIYNSKNQVIFPQLTVINMQQAEERMYARNGSAFSIENGHPHPRLIPGQLCHDYRKARIVLYQQRRLGLHQCYKTVKAILSNSHYCSSTNYLLNSNVHLYVYRTVNLLSGRPAHFRTYKIAELVPS